jgi:hypothetical protein
MKDKIIERSKKLIDVWRGNQRQYRDVPGKLYELLEEFAEEIDFLYPTLNRDKVMDILTNKVMSSLDEIADAICSLSLPTLSDGEIEKALTDYIEEQFVGLNPLMWADEIKNVKSHFLYGFKACQELTKPKEER